MRGRAFFHDDEGHHHADGSVGHEAPAYQVHLLFSNSESFYCVFAATWLLKSLDRLANTRAHVAESTIYRLVQSTHIAVALRVHNTGPVA